MRRSLLILAALLAAAVGLAAQVGGTVVNGTTGRPAAGVAVSLIAVQAGVAPAATTRSDAAGRFRFAQAPASGQPVMLRADYRGVPYYQALAAGQNSARLTVYEVSGDAAQIHLTAEVTVVQPQNGQLAVVDEYVVDNKLDRTLYRRGGLFRFRLPRNVRADGARVIGPNGMPITRPVEPAAQPGDFGLDYPIRPGETRFQVSYRLPYATQQAEITDDPPYPVDHLLVYVPPPMKFSGDGFNPPGQDEGYQVYEARSTAHPLRFTVSGDAPLPQQMQASGSGSGAAASGDPNAAAAPAAGIIPPKSWMEKNSFAVLAILLVLAATGFGYLLTRPETAVAAAGAAALAAPPGAAASASAASGAAPKSELDRLKDDLFLLEVQRHTGHLDDAGYRRARRQLDARMRALAQAPGEDR